ncbi:MAG: gluconate transporter [Bacteroidales bacterium]|nr:gluconate transporter [Bacteroidales bacterium]
MVYIIGCHMPLLIVALGILLLILLITVIKIDAFISFIVASIAIGIAEGMPLQDVVQSVEKGIGDTLGSLVMILGFGAMLGKLVAESGAAQRIASKLIQVFGIRYIQWALVVTGFIVGIPMFYNVGFVILVPLIFTVSTATGLPLLYVGIPMLASLSVTHGFLPPHPSPTAITLMFDANMGKTLLLGMLIAIPVIIIAGPLFARTIKNIRATPLKEFVNPRILKEEELPGMLISIAAALLPVLLIITSTLLGFILPEDTLISEINAFIGNPSIAMLVSVFFAIYALGIARGKKMKAIMEMTTGSVMSITMILLIIAGAGILKQVLIDSGVGDYIANALGKTSLSPLLLGWIIAAAIRVCVGSATVAGLTAAGIVLPLFSTVAVSPELMVLSIGSGSLILSHVNDTGFWMYKEYFNLSIRDTFLTWTVMETLVGVLGLAGVLILSSFL